MRERLRHDAAPDLPPVREGVVRLTGLAGLPDFVKHADPEIAANAMLCAVNQAAYLLRRQVEQLGRDFVEHGGFTERLYAARAHARDKDEPAAPACPVCGKEMRKRTAGKGPNAGRPFWGCAGYPECRGLLKVSNGSAPSDKLK